MIKKNDKNRGSNFNSFSTTRHTIIVRKLNLKCMQESISVSAINTVKMTRNTDGKLKHGIDKMRTVIGKPTYAKRKINNPKQGCKLI